MTEAIRIVTDKGQVKFQLRSNNRRIALRKKVTTSPLQSVKLGILFSLLMYREWYMDKFDENPF